MGQSTLPATIRRTSLVLQRTPLNNEAALFLTAWKPSVWVFAKMPDAMQQRGFLYTVAMSHGSVTSFTLSEMVGLELRPLVLF